MFKFLKILFLSIVVILAIVITYILGSWALLDWLGCLAVNCLSVPFMHAPKKASIIGQAGVNSNYEWVVQVNDGYSAHWSIMRVFETEAEAEEWCTENGYTIMGNHWMN